MRSHWCKTVLKAATHWGNIKVSSPPYTYCQLITLFWQIVQDRTLNKISQQKMRIIQWGQKQSRYNYFYFLWSIFCRSWNTNSSNFPYILHNWIHVTPTASKNKLFYCSLYFCGKGYYVRMYWIYCCWVYIIQKKQIFNLVI